MWLTQIRLIKSCLQKWQSYRIHTHTQKTHTKRTNGTSKDGTAPTQNHSNCTRQRYLNHIWVLFTVLAYLYSPDNSWLVEVLLYRHRNRRSVRDRSPGCPSRLSHSSWASDNSYTSLSFKHQFATGKFPVYGHFRMFWSKLFKQSLLHTTTPLSLFLLLASDSSSSWPDIT